MGLDTVVSELCKKHGTRDPFCIAESCGILVLVEPLGNIRGYYSRSHRQKVIHVNQDLDEYTQNYVAAHELGHAILHPTENTPFLRTSTYLCVNRLEREANQFAALLVFSDDELLSMTDCSVDQISVAIGLPTHLVKWRMEQLIR